MRVGQRDVGRRQQLRKIHGGRHSTKAPPFGGLLLSSGPGINDGTASLLSVADVIGAVALACAVDAGYCEATTSSVGTVLPILLGGLTTVSACGLRMV